MPCKLMHPLPLPCQKLHHDLSKTSCGQPQKSRAFDILQFRSSVQTVTQQDHYVCGLRYISWVIWQMTIADALLPHSTVY
jgi:hypothetical protein